MVDWCKETVDAQNESQREELVEAVLSSDRIFVKSSRPPARSIAMNLTQLGLQAYVAGDATTPAIEKGDLLIVISPAIPWTRTTIHDVVPGAWTRTTIYDVASGAKSSGASVVLLTDRIPSARIRDVCDLLFVLGPDFDEAAGLFVDELVTLITEKRRKN